MSDKSLEEKLKEQSVEDLVEIILRMYEDIEQIPNPAADEVCEWVRTYFDEEEETG